MHFETVIELTELLKSRNVFHYTFVTVKALALAFIMLKVIDEFLSTIDSDKSFPFGKFINFFGTALLILSSEWIIDLGEEQLNIIDNYLFHLGEHEDIFTKVMQEFDDQSSELPVEQGFFTKIFNLFVGDFIDSFYATVVLLIGTVVAGFFKIADMVVSMSVLIIRMIIVQFLKLTFPIAILFGIFDSTRNFFYSWIKRYVGVIVLGVAYIGVFWLVQSFIEIMLKPSPDEVFPISDLANKAFITMCVAYPIKFKLLKEITSYVYSMFS